MAAPLREVHQSANSTNLLDLTASGGFKTGSGKYIKVDSPTLLKAKQLLNEENDSTDKNVMLRSDSSFKGFQSAAGNCIKLDDSALRKAEKLMSDDYKDVSNANTSTIKVSSQSIRKAQKLISHVMVSPKENKLSQNMIGNGLATDDELKVSDLDNMGGNEQDYEFSQWFDEEMEKETKLIEEQAMNGLISLQTGGENTSNDSKMDVGFKVQKDSLIKECKTEIECEIETKTECIEAKEIVSEMEISKELQKKTNLIGFSTAAGKNIKLGETALETAENLLFSAVSTNNDGMESKLKFELDRIDATGDCHKLVSASPEDASTVSNNLGFQTASGKILRISDKALKKASNLVENCFDEKDNILDCEAKDVRKLNLDIKDNVKPAVPDDGNTPKDGNSLSESFKKEINIPLSETLSLEEELAALTSLKSKTTGKSFLDEKMHNGFQGFQSASGKMFEMSDASLKKAASLISCDSADNVTDKQLNVQKHEVGVNPCSNNEFLESFKGDFSHQGSGINSFEDRFDILLAMKNSKSKTNNITSAYAKDSKKSRRLPPGSNVPKGFRPFKAPRITKPKKTIDATTTHEKVKGMKLDDRVCETNLVKHDRKMANEMSDRVNSIESTSDVKDISLTISKKALPLGDMLNSDEKLEHFEKELVPKKLEGMQEKHGPDIQDCYNGLLSQMFADEMEPDEVSGIISATSNDLDSNITNTNPLNKCVESMDYEKSESLKNKHDNTISKFEDEIEIKNTGSKTLGDSTKFNVETLNVENNSNIECKYGGFSTASGKKLDVKAESLTKAESILNDSDALSLHRQENTDLENDIDSTGDCIVPDVEVNHQSENKVQNHENRSNTMPKSNMPTSKSLCMFKSASGKQLDVTYNVLTEAKCKFNDFESNLDSFDLKPRESMNVKERPQEVPDIETSKDIKNSSNRCKLHFVNNIKSKSEKSNSPLVQNGLLQQMHLEEANGSSLFQKANGKCINVPEAALKVATDNFEENIPRTIAGSLFQTASGNSITISETSLKHARDSLQDSKLDSGLLTSEKFTSFQASSSLETKSIGGSLFQTASGKDITVSEEALKNVRSRIKDSDFEVLPVNEEEQLSLTANDKIMTVSDETLKLIRKSSEQVNKQSEVSESNSDILFQTASGKDVAVSARIKLKSTESYNADIASDCLFQTASGRSVTISDNALKVARKNLDDIDVKNTQLESKYYTSLFKTAGGENVNISEPSLNIAKGSMDISEIDKGKPKVCCGPMFQTASGKNVNISKEALRRATDHLKECEDDIKMTKNPCVSSFKTSSNGMKIAVETLHRERDILTESDTALEIQRKSSGCMFQTASGKNVKISEEALKPVQETFKESEIKSEVPKISVNSLFQTASGKSVSVSDKALNEIKENWNDSTENSNMQMPHYSSNSSFQTASGKNVAVSERALKDIKANWTVSAEDFSIPTPKYSSNSLFQTASGKNVAVSEKALKVARDNFKETETNNLSSVKESSNMKPSESPKETNHCSVGSLFQTAGGKTVTVSEKALKAARDSFRESETSNRTVEKEVWSSETLSRNQTSKGSLNQNASFLFQTASGKDVPVSENALKVARDNLKDSEMDILTNGKEVPLQSSKRDFQPRNISSNIGSLFQTASGKHVNVSEKALTLARESLKDTESKTLLEGQHKSTEESSYSDQNFKSSSKFPGSLFHTASGKHVNVSEKALKFARDSLKDTESNPLLGGQQNNVEKDSSSNQNVGSSNKFSGSLFQTASGKNVNVSERALKFARDSLKDTESEEKDNSFEENSSSEQNVRPSSKFSGSLFQTASGKNVNVSEKALKFARDSLKNSESEGKNSSSDQNVRPTSKVPSSLFQTASGKSVDVSENALSEARNALDSENKNCQESVPSTVRTEELQIDSGTKDMESLSTSLEALSSLKKKMFESRGGTSTAKRGKSEHDEGDQDRTPLKRRRVDMEESVRGSPIERAPLRSGPEG